MGVQNYDGDRRLKNTLNDAHAIEGVFHGIGFDTRTLTDETADGGKVDGDQMYMAIEEFVDEIDQDTVAVFAFMGAPLAVFRTLPLPALRALDVPQGTGLSRAASTT